MLRIFLVLVLWSAAGLTSAASTILVFGDSLSAGYGVPQGSGWVDLLQQRLERENNNYKVINASLSGETSVGGKARIAGVLMKYKPDIVVLGLGANDGLRGAQIETIRANLLSIIAESRRRGSEVLLVGMQLPPNYGVYAEKFRELYFEIAKSQRLPLVPFILEGFATDRTAFQSDGVHPTPSAQAHMLATVWKELQPMLKRRGKP
jgi:acyl-CoA thioesterase-1